MSVYIISDGPTLHRVEPGKLTTKVLPGSPSRLQVSDSKGVLATLTTGAKTVTVRGQQRTFTEDKRPFIDSFDRTTSNGWGTSPGGGVWSNANGTDSNYSVANGAGVINMTAANSSRHTSLINDITDVDVRLSWSLDKMPEGNASSLGLSFAYSSTNSQYRARLSILTTGTVQLILERESGGSTTTIGSLTTVGTGYVVGDVWHIRAQRQGTTLRCRAWKNGTAEPGTWTHEVTDNVLGAGRVGVRALASSGSTAPPFNFLVHDVQLYSGKWANPPTVTHDTWVRLLSQPFSGVWTPSLADQIRAWAVDTSPDALAYATMFTTGAPEVTDLRLGAGVKVAGQSLYGPNAADGTRREGSDFHEFMGLPWNFSNGETAPDAGAEWEGCLDCSGYVRMVYGYHMGIPMVRDQDFDGINLPRRTRDIGPSGPGVIVAQSTDAAPSLENIQIGDVPLFDADSSDAIAGQIDHNGIYIGVDSEGNHRFVNSRKTPNGPTFGDLGGNSTLNGTGLYAESLRIIRRF